MRRFEHNPSDAPYHAMPEHDDALQPLMPPAPKPLSAPKPAATRTGRGGFDYTSLAGEDLDATSQQQHIYIKTADQVNRLAEAFPRASAKRKAEITQHMQSLLQAAQALGGLLEKAPEPAETDALTAATKQHAVSVFLLLVSQLKPSNDNAKLVNTIHQHLYGCYTSGMDGVDFRIKLTKQQKTNLLHGYGVFTEKHAVFQLMKEQEAKLATAKEPTLTPYK
ncbi:MAG: hypothetical protein P1U40_03455 [Coxiellaceae bacterium]|nr:hypothetical protein [Coxiellaceae bacterium]